MTLPAGVIAWRREVERRLERSGTGRRLLALAASLYILVRRRRWCAVERTATHWVHRWGGTTLADVSLSSATPEAYDADVRDVVLHRYWPAAGAVVVDVGAGVGHETRLLATLVGPTGRVVAIEANPRVHGCLADMVDRNHLRNVTTLQLALADERGEVHIEDSDDHLANAIVGTAVGVAVPADTFDHLAPELGIDHVDFLKMNIEGAEVAALRGMPATLARTRAVCISCHDFLAAEGGDDRLRTKAEVRSLLTAAGFVVHERRDPRPWVADYLYGEREAAA